MRLATALAATLVSFPAMASGGLWCTADDGKVKIDVGSGVTRGMGSPPFAFEARVKISDEAVPQDLRDVAFERPTQYWLDSESLNLLVYREREDEPHGYVKARIMTTIVEEGTFDGEFEVSVYDVEAPGIGDEPLIYTGKVSCGVE